MQVRANKAWRNINQRSFAQCFSEYLDFGDPLSGLITKPYAKNVFHQFCPDMANYINFKKKE